MQRNIVNLTGNYLKMFHTRRLNNVYLSYRTLYQVKSSHSRIVFYYTNYTSNLKHLPVIQKGIFNIERYISSSSNRSSKEKTKVEETVEVLKEELKSKESSAVETTAKKDVAATKPVKRSLGKRILDEIVHYYHGFRLLFIDFRVSSRLVWKVLNGKSLSRRENKQLIRTVADIFRLVPFSVFILVPFMELLLPVFLKLFPQMLPSTFQTTSDKVSKKYKILFLYFIVLFTILFY